MTIDAIKRYVCEISGVSDADITSKCRGFKILSAKSMFCHFLRDNKLGNHKDIPDMVNLSGVSYYEAIRRHYRLYHLSKEYKEQYDRLVYEVAKISNKGRIIVIISDEGEDVVFYNTSKNKILSEEELSIVACNALKLRSKLNI